MAAANPRRRWLRTCSVLNTYLAFFFFFFFGFVMVLFFFDLLAAAFFFPFVAVFFFVPAVLADAFLAVFFLAVFFLAASFLAVSFSGPVGTGSMEELLPCRVVCPLLLSADFFRLEVPSIGFSAASR